LISRLTTIPKTVLIAEDDPNDVHLMELAVQQVTPSGVNFQIVRDGEEAISYIKGEGRFRDRMKHPLPDLALLDVRMPKLDGFQVLDWIRNKSDFKNLKVFVWADSQFEADVSRAQSGRADRVIPKPGDMATLRSILREIAMLLTKA
jgi:CheY-like chemotaxis protein